MIKIVVYAVLGTFGLVEVLETFVYKYIILDKLIDYVKSKLGGAEQTVVNDVRKIV